MGKRRSMMRAKKYDAYKTTTNRPWSDLTHGVLLLVMMKLGVFDLLAFNGVCKSWRSLPLSNRNKFMVSRPPMPIFISTDANEEDYYYLEDFEGRKFKINIPHIASRTCVGVTSGYLIMFGWKTSDFLLLNPITRHGLHFPDFPFDFDVPGYYLDYYIDAIIVFSPLISERVLVVFCRIYNKIWFCIAGKREWTQVFSHFRIIDLHAFNGKIYALHSNSRLSEVRLYPTPKVTLLEIKKFPSPDLPYPRFLTSVENLYVADQSSHYPNNIHEINFSKMEWVSRKMMGEEYGFLYSSLDTAYAVIGAELSADLHSQYRRYAVADESGNGRLFYAKMWYFFHNCLNVNLLHE